MVGAEGVFGVVGGVEDLLQVCWGRGVARGWWGEIGRVVRRELCSRGGGGGGGGGGGVHRPIVVVVLGD